MDWNVKSVQCDYDILMYGIACHPCLFGENSAHVIEHPSCISHTMAYLGLMFSSNWLGIYISECISPGSQIIAFTSSSLCSSCMIGTYGGEMRTKLRHRYGIDGDKNQDFLVHFLCSPCATCQEAQEIRLRKNEHFYYDINNQTQWTPVKQEMMK